MSISGINNLSNLSVRLSQNSGANSFTTDKTRILRISELKGNPAITNRSDAVSILRLAEKSELALSTIIDLKEQQRSLISKAAISDDAKKVQIDTELQSLQEEIGRIADNVDFNSYNSLQGGVFQILSAEQNFSKIISLPDINFIIEDPGLSTINIDSILLSESRVDVSIDSARRAYVGISNGLQDSGVTISDLSLLSKNDTSVVNTEEVDKLASLSSDIAKKIAFPVEEEDANSIAIANSKLAIA